MEGRAAFYRMAAGGNTGLRALGPNAQLSADGLADCEELLGGPAGINFLPFIFGAYDELEAACSPDDNPFRSNDNDPSGLLIDTDSAALTVTWDFADVTLTTGGRTTPPRR